MHIHEAAFQVVSRQAIVVDKTTGTVQVDAASAPTPPERWENGRCGRGGCVQDFFRYLGDTVAMRILVVDDEQAVRESLERTLRFEGYEVTVAGDGVEALDHVEQDRPDAVVLDVLMPRLDGLETCRRLRARGDSVPVLLLTARDGVADRVTGLDVGADDYLVKPFALEELLARLRALLRRALVGATGSAGEAGRLEFGDLWLDLGTREVRRDDRTLELTRTEYQLLELFLRHPRQVLTRSVILDRVWGFDFETSSNSLEVYVGHLRRKTEAGGEPRLLHTVRGVGYVLLERAVTNVLDNAAKWSPQGGTVEVWLRGGELAVRDHGPGIAAEDLPFVFDRFYRAPAARHLPGSGLGLAIVREAVEAHGGTVEVTSTPGGGTMVRLQLPVSPPTASPPTAAPPTAAPTAAPPTAAAG